MGVGKTSIARKAAKASRMKFRDSDALIAESAGQSIESIFAEHGEEKFRELEHRVLEDLMSDSEPAIIATGGGVVLRQDNRQLLAQNALVVWLKGDLKTAASRLVQSPNPRPLLPKGDASEMEAALTDLFDRRRHLYEEVADHILNVSVMPQADAVNALLGIATEMQMRNSQ